MAIENSIDCASNNTVSYVACEGIKGGVYDIQSSPTWKSAADGSWNGSTVNPTDHQGNILLGWEYAVFSGNIGVWGTPLAIWTDKDTNNKTALGIGANSSTINAFVQQGLLPAFPTQVGVYMGSRSELQGVDGEIIFGGYDTARVNGSFTWFPMGSRLPGLDCPLQVLLDDIVLINNNGTQSLSSDTSSRIPACLDMIQMGNTLSGGMFEKWSSLTGHPNIQPTDGSPPYTEQTYPGENEALIGELLFKLSNEQGDIYSSVLPHHELYSQERGSDSEGRYVVTNATRGMASVLSPLTGIMGVPFLGATFLSQNYLVLDFEKGMFGLAPAILGAMDASKRQVACLTKNPTKKHIDIAVILSSVFLGVMILICIALANRLWKGRPTQPTPLERPNKPGNDESQTEERELDVVREVSVLLSEQQLERGRDSIGPDAPQKLVRSKSL